MEAPISTNRFFNRDLSWLKFNELILDQAGKTDVPVLERIKFLSIYSSNLDEFYRVRVPILYAVDKIVAKGKTVVDAGTSAKQATVLIEHQLQKFGKILTEEIVPDLKKNKIVLWYNMPLDERVFKQTSAWFYSQVLAFLKPAYIAKDDFYPKNHQLYFLVTIKENDGTEQQVVLNIPSDKLSRFLTINDGAQTHVVFIDDIIKFHLPVIFKNVNITGCYSFKITRDAKIDLKDEYEGDIADQIEKQIDKREFGLATRFLYQPGIPLRIFELMTQKFKLQKANMVKTLLYALMNGNRL
jgi:polyphosphate kinase